MNIYNDGPTPLRIDPQRSHIIAPSGRAHPILAQSAAPGGFMQLILPPVRLPSIEDRGFHGPDYHYSSGYDEGPQYFDWTGDSQIQMLLVYDRGGAMVEDRFVIQRQQVK